MSHFVHIFTYDQNSVSIEITHKYLYGSNQGQHENIYIALDIDGVYLSGNLDLPDTMMTKVSPAAAWEFCIYVYDQNNYGFYDKKGRKHENPAGMQVRYTGVGADEKLIIELPRRIAARIDKIRFTIATTKPGFVNPDTTKNMMSRATDIYPGGNEALINHAEIGSYAEMLLEPGRSRGTTEYKYVYNDFGRQIYEKKTVDTRNYLTYYTYGYGMETRRAGTGISQLRYLHKDILGSVTAVSDDYGRVSTELEYAPFGELISGSAGSLGNFGFTGQEWDNDITMYHFPARYYEPLWGRFMTPDPYTNLPDDARNFNYQPYITRSRSYHAIVGMPNYPTKPHAINVKDPAKLNLYPYVANNPITHVDPFGFYEKDPYDSFSECYAKCVNSPEVKESQKILGNLLVGPIHWSTQALIGIGGQLGEKFLGWLAKAPRMNEIVIPLAGSSLSQILIYGAGGAKLLVQGYGLYTVGVATATLLSTSEFNLYCILICSGYPYKFTK